MNLHERLEALVELGNRLKQPNEYLDALMHRTFYNNKWFTVDNQQLAVRAIADYFLEASKLKAWADQYTIADDPPLKKIGVIMAGNIPLVGFHDFLCVFVAGHQAQIKLSEKDQFLFPYLVRMLEEIDDRTGIYFEIVNKLKGF